MKKKWWLRIQASALVAMNIFKLILVWVDKDRIGNVSLI